VTRSWLLSAPGLIDLKKGIGLEKGIVLEKETILEEDIISTYLVVCRFGMLSCHLISYTNCSL